ncbi:hypothetical protein BC629DRAFT_1724067 [Irpex lacteus]|nr:hypothetical protein BC629DRAFT_1724067 [Irpex lacteus]
MAEREVSVVGALLDCAVAPLCLMELFRVSFKQGITHDDDPDGVKSNNSYAIIEHTNLTNQTLQNRTQLIRSRLALVLYIRNGSVELRAAAAFRSKVNTCFRIPGSSPCVQCLHLKLVLCHWRGDNECGISVEKRVLSRYGHRPSSTTVSVCRSGCQCSVIVRIPGSDTASSIKRTVPGDEIIYTPHDFGGCYPGKSHPNQLNKLACRYLHYRKRTQRIWPLNFKAVVINENRFRKQLRRRPGSANTEHRGTLIGRYPLVWYWARPSDVFRTKRFALIKLLSVGTDITYRHLYSPLLYATKESESSRLQEAALSTSLSLEADRAELQMHLRTISEL